MRRSNACRAAGVSWVEEGPHMLPAGRLAAFAQRLQETLVIHIIQ
jgi:hypothetical protein